MQVTELQEKLVQAEKELYSSPITEKKTLGIYEASVIAESKTSDNDSVTVSVTSGLEKFLCLCPQAVSHEMGSQQLSAYTSILTIPWGKIFIFLIIPIKL